MAVGEALIDGETEVAYARLKGMNYQTAPDPSTSVAPGLPATLSAESRDAEEVVDYGDMRYSRFRSLNLGTRTDTLESWRTCGTQDSYGEGSRISVFSSCEPDTSMEQSTSRSCESFDKVLLDCADENPEINDCIVDAVGSFTENVDSLYSKDDGNLRDDEGNVIRRVDDKKNDFDQQVPLGASTGRLVKEVGDGNVSNQDLSLRRDPTFMSQVELDYAGRVVEKVGGGRVGDHELSLQEDPTFMSQVELDHAGRIVEKVRIGKDSEHGLSVQRDPTFVSECGQEVELASIPGGHNHHRKNVQPEFRGASVELVPEPTHVTNMTVQLESERNVPPAAISLGDYTVGCYGSSSASTSTVESRTTRSTNVSGDTELVNNTKQGAGARRDYAMSATPPPPQTKTGRIDVVDAKEAKSSTFPKVRGFFKKKRPSQTKSSGILLTPKYSKKISPNILYMRRTQRSNNDTARGEKTVKMGDYIASRSMNAFTTRANTNLRPGTPMPKTAIRREVASPIELEREQMNSETDDADDDETVDSSHHTSSFARMASDNTTVTNESTTASNESTAVTPVSRSTVTCESSAPSSVDRRNAWEKAVDATYGIVKCCCADNFDGDSIAFSGGNDLVDERDVETVEETEYVNVKDVNAMGAIDANNAMDSIDHPMLNAVNAADKNHGVEMGLCEFMVEPCGQGIIMVGSEDNPAIDIDASDNRVKKGEVAMAPTVSKEQRTKVPKRFGLRLPSFKRKKKDAILDEDVMADILDEIKRMGSTPTIETYGNSGSDGFDLPQDFSDLVANAIAEEAVLSCLEEENRKYKVPYY